MTNVLIRDVPAEDLDEIRAAATEAGESLQVYLRNAVHGQATYLRRQAALDATAERLRDRPGVSARDRHAVLDDVEEAQAERAGDLVERPDR